MKRMISTLMATILLALSFAVPVFAQESSDNSVLIDSKNVQHLSVWKNGTK